MTITGKLIAVAAAMLVSLPLMGAAVPTSVDDEQQSDVGFGRVVDGRIIPVESVPLDLEEPTAPQPGAISPMLINWNQWYGCFSLNNENDVFANYVHYWDGQAQDVRLKCGNESYGYKHIRAGHESQWQNEFNAGKAAGWKPELDGMESWDDLMSSAAGSSVTWPEYLRNDPPASKKCSVARFSFYNRQTWQELYTFSVRAVWATNSDRLITAFPTTRNYC